MVRVKLTQVNRTEVEQRLDFSQFGDLVQPITDVKTVTVLKYTIPNSTTPIMSFKSSTYLFTLTYKGYIHSEYVVYASRGTDTYVSQPVREMDHLVTMFNDCISSVLTGLNGYVVAGGDSLPTLEAPRFIFNVDTSRFELIAPLIGYESSLTNPIKLYCNPATYHILATFPSIYYPNNTYAESHLFLFNEIPENVYQVNYIKTYQESVTFSSLVLVRNILITTSMPVETMIICSDSLSANQSSLNVLQSYTVPYTQGMLDNQESFDYNAPQNGYRKCKVFCNNLYSVKVNG